MFIKLKNISKSSSLYFALLIGALYLFTAPYTVQSGDTGEMVTNAFFLRVSHPPGYPLWTLFYHLPVKYLSFLTPFHIASILTAIASVLALLTIYRSFKNQTTFILLLILASTSLFWRYSILPDVFGFHTVFLALVFLACMRPELLDRPYFIFLISLSVAHHHIILFAFPLYAYALFTGNWKRKFAWSVVFGMISFSIYFLMLLFNTEDYGSWRSLSTFQDVISHFLRKDFGTFQLQSVDKSKGDLAWLHFLFVNVVYNFWSLFLVLIFALYKIREGILTELKRSLVFFVSIVSYLVVFLAAGVTNMDLYGQSVFERFLIQPLILIAFFVIFIVNLFKVRIPRWLTLCLLTNVGLNVVMNYHANNYRQNTIIQDYIESVFNILPEKSVLYVTGDTEGFGAYYVHDVLKKREDVIYLHPSLRAPWGAAKAKKKYPDVLDFKNKAILDSINFDKYRFFL